MKKQLLGLVLGTFTMASLGAAATARAEDKPAAEKPAEKPAEPTGEQPKSGTP